MRHKIAAFAELFLKNRALVELNATLEERVQQRTAELEKSEAALRAASERKDAFLATLAHELRNPLAPLRTGLDLLMRAPLPSSSTRTLAAMDRQLTHMVRLIDDLLDMSRISRGVLELRKESVEVTAIVQAAVESAEPFLQQRRQSVRIESAQPLYAVLDPTRIAQVIGNLLHNASKQTGPDQEIRVELKAEVSRVVVRVIDPGTGIAKGDLERVFEMFAKLEHSGSQAKAGLGIGLALSRQLARLHEGTLVAESAGEGQGATFTLSLPLLVPPRAVSEAAEPLSVASEAAEKPLSILVVEDNEDAADTLVAWLESLGHHVRIARTGPEGLASIQDAVPQLVFCDLGLPGMSGLEICRRVRSLDLGMRPTMIALTGWGTANDRRETREAGFDEHLVKPVATPALRDVLSTFRAPG